MTGLIGKRYLLHKLIGQGGMGAVYQATDRLTGQTVALKQVTALAEQLQDTPGSDSSDFRLALSDEFRTLASLRHPNIITVLDYGFETPSQPFFTMELLENGQTILAAGHDAPFDARVGLLLQILQALAYLHRRGILHRDLKPGNILVNRDGTAKLLDFGLSLGSVYSRSRVQATTVGTLAYMAPELFGEEPASVASDLYSVGVIACELLAARHPFNMKNVAALLNGILTGEPDLTGLDDQPKTVIERLLARQPEDRYSSAEAAMRALCEATGQPPPPETPAVRESFLQAARFVGREAELDHLKNALNDIVDARRSSSDTGFEAKGSAWLVGGESGVGKSRLLDEIRVRALVRGALVLRGQGVTEGSIPYQLWRDPLRRLILVVELDDDEAGVLKTLVADIETLLERPIPDAPPLDPQFSQTRMMKVITDIFGRLEQPTVVILEDLQWAGDENLALLDRLGALVADLPLVVIASYRDDERPNLPEALSGIQLLKLRRLDETGIADLSESILGAAGRQPQIVRLLQRETEGNAFFLIEVVRALAEQVGQLDRITQASLRANLLPQGIQDIVQRRLNRVSERAQRLLQAAAVGGRELDLDVLRALDAGKTHLDGWLADCANAAVLDVDEDRWRFAHDKLREMLIANIGDDELSGFHRQLGETLERVHPDQPEHIPAMAHHFREAGVHDKAMRYLKWAGDLANESFANQEAIGFYRMAIEELQLCLDGADNPDALYSAFLHLYENLGDVLEVVGQHQEARDAFQIALEKTPEDERLSRARLQRKIGNTWESQRAYEEAMQAYRNAVEWLGAEVPDTDTTRWQEWLQNQILQIRVYYWQNKPDEMKQLAERIRPAVERLANSAQRRMFFLNLALVGLRRDKFTVSDETLTYAQSVFGDDDDPEYSGEDNWDNWSRFGVGFLHLWRGNLDMAEKHLKISQVAAERSGDVTTGSRIFAYLTVLARKRGQVEEVRHYAQRTLDMSSAGQMIEYIGSAKGHLAWVALREGNLVEAHALGQEGCDLMRQVAIGKVILWICLWPLIGAEIALGQVAEAVEHARELLGPTQQPFPEPVKAGMEAAIEAREQGEVEAARSHLVNTAEIARQWGYT